LFLKTPVLKWSIGMATVFCNLIERILNTGSGKKVSFARLAILFVLPVILLFLRNGGSCMWP